APSDFRPAFWLRSRRDREALQLALKVDPLDAATKRALKKQRCGKSKAAAAKAIASATTKPPSAQQSTKPKPKPLTVAKNPAAACKLQPAKPAPAVEKTGRKQKVEFKEKRRQRKNFASRKYQQAKNEALAAGSAPEMAYREARQAHRAALQEWDSN
ncbi:unnamed protein product, partial [Symbiodinium pilosum]